MLEDYPVDVPQSTRSDDTLDGWACPVSLPPPDPGETPADQLVRRALDEVARLRPWYDEARRQRGRTAFGLSGLASEGIDTLVETLARFAAGESATAPPGALFAVPDLFRYLTDDAKAFFTEAATAQPSLTPPGAEELLRWLYWETALGDVLYRVRDRLAASEDPVEHRAQRGILPVEFIRLGRNGAHR